jgi:chromosomal replication initiation ATPase DnaA
MKHILFYKFVSCITDVLKISEDSLFSKSKRRDIVDARHLLYYLCSRRMIRVVYIQKYMKENGYSVPHSSVIHGIKVVSDKIKSDPDYKEIINQIETIIYGKSISIQDPVLTEC